MRQYTVYVCETCGYEDTNANNMELHEAIHLGLTANQLREYKALKAHAIHMENILYGNDNDETRRAYNQAVDQVTQFEIAHNIKK